MSIEPQVNSKRTSRNLKNLFLDPNNYRFADNENHKYVPDDSFLDPQVQKRTRMFIEGPRQENIKDLLASFKSNGFLDVDIIQVKEISDNVFLVLEGNRRVAALKALQEDYEKGLDIGVLDPSVFRSVKFEIHNSEDNEKHLIIMGLKHISGNKKWSTLNQSKLIHDFLYPYRNDSRDEYLSKENELCDSLGITKARLRSMIRIYNLIQAYKESDFSQQFDSSMYGIFEEIIKKPVMREWLEWSDNGYKADNSINLEKIFSWISKTEQFSQDLNEDTDIDDSDKDEFYQEYEEYEPIITKSLEIRDLALFINNDNAVEIMERERSLARGLAASGTVDKQNYQSALSKLGDSVKALSSFKSYVTVEDTEILSEAKEKLSSIIPKKSNLNIEGGNFTTAFEFGVRNHFSTIEIVKYKSFKNFQLDKLSKINIFAGFNNSGKTSLLEAVYLLTQQNDISSFFNLIKEKNKTQLLSPVLLNKIFTSNMQIKGIYNNTTTSINLEKFDAEEIDKKDDYITSYQLVSQIDDRILKSTVHTFVHETMMRNNDSILKLCYANIKSPYFYSIDELIKNYTKSVETKYKNPETGEIVTALNLVIDFLKEVDESINDVRFTDEGELKRFIVESSKSKDKNFDITTYGEGLQRIFYIALSFAACKNGVILIDEFETAIHYSLLIKFTAFVQKLVEIFNVQLFLTSHSNECISAFVTNGISNEEISCFQLKNKSDKIQVKSISGERLNYLIDNIKLDIRGDLND